MTTDPLPGAQAEEVSELAQREVERFAKLLADEVAATPMRADANLNARDFQEALAVATRKYENGVTPT